VSGSYGAQIVVPAGSLASTVGIGLERDSTNSPAFALTDVNAGGATYELIPHGTAFSLPVTLHIPFDPMQLPDDATPVLYKAETGGTFTALPTTVNGNFLEATVTNFSWVIPGYAATKPRAVYALQAAGTYTAAGVASYRINSITGALTGPTSTALAGDSPTSVVAHPSRRFMYVSNSGSTTVNGIAPNSVSTYRLNTLNGQIVGAATGSVSTGAPAGYQTTMPVIHPSGKFLYVMNFDVASINPLGFISLFTINGTTGALTLSTSVTSGGDARAMGIAFNRLGTLAYVLYGGSSSTNPFATQVKVYSVDGTTGELNSPLSGVAAGALGSNPWSIAIDPNGKFVYVACLSTDEVRAYGINGTTGALTFLGSTITQSKPSSLAIDSFGRFLYVGRQTPFNNVNVQSYQIDATTGGLTLANSVLTSCVGGACGGPVPVVAEPQGQFVFANDVKQGLSAFGANATTGALTSAGNLTNVFVPWTSGVGIPFTFAATGTSPVWQNNCTLGCALFGAISAGGGGGTNPTPPTSHYLTVTQGAFVGYVTSSPAGINIGPATIANPIPNNDFSAPFPASSSVQLCTSPPPQPAQAYDVTWTGSCSGTGQCTTVVVNGDTQCHAEFSVHW
jgi:6-phosphogluconolactonase (cycloisomerase 2 family)